jgi:hypothetical protein
MLKQLCETVFIFGYTYVESEFWNCEFLAENLM